jgi:hypothetical protein
MYSQTECLYVYDYYYWKKDTVAMFCRITVVGKWNSTDRNSAPGIPRKFHRNSGVVKSGTGIPQNFNPIQALHENISNSAEFQ